MSSRTAKSVAHCQHILCFCVEYEQHTDESPASRPRVKKNLHKSVNHSRGRPYNSLPLY